MSNGLAMRRRRRRCMGGGGYTASQFVTTWELTVDDAAGKTITLPLRSGYTYDMTVDWGDGTVTAVTAYDDADRIHEYATTGTKTVVIDGTCQAWYFNNGGDKLNLRTVEHWGEDVGFTGLGLERAFYGCANATAYADMPYYPVTSLYRTWRGNTSCTSFGAVNALTGVTSLTEAWYDAQSATSFPAVSSLVDVTAIISAWQNAISALSFPQISTLVKVANAYRAWFNGAQSSTVFDVSGLVLCAYFNEAWYNHEAMATVPVFPSASTALIGLDGAFGSIGTGMGGTVVELWNATNFPNITGYVGAFTGCTDLTNYADIPAGWK